MQPRKAPLLSVASSRAQHEPQGQLLGQRGGGGLRRQPEEELIKKQISRLAAICRGKGITLPPGMIGVSTHKGVWLDEPEWVARLTDKTIKWTHHDQAPSRPARHPTPRPSRLGRWARLCC